MLAQACLQAAEWHRAGILLDIAVNVSARQLAGDEFEDDAWRALVDSGLTPRHWSST